MPRSRKYDYKEDYPVRLFITVPIKVKQQLDELYTQKEINDIVVKYLSNLLENNRKID